MTRFPDDALAAIRDARIVRLTTARASGEARREVPIWIVADAAGRILVRSVRGERGRGYRDLLAGRPGSLRVGDRQLAVRAVPATDPERIAACSEALRSKYANGKASLAAMLRDEVIGTTLELQPA
ncbi:MAG: DUF2255 family protein [Chloroflexota bacterium]|nr:DUF2255 family protein [Chloroflexota bacterium]